MMVFGLFCRQFSVLFQCLFWSCFTASFGVYFAFAFDISLQLVWRHVNVGFGVCFIVGFGVILLSFGVVLMLVLALFQCW